MKNVIRCCPIERKIFRNFAGWSNGKIAHWQFKFWRCPGWRDVIHMRLSYCFVIYRGEKTCTNCTNFIRANFWHTPFSSCHLRNNYIKHYDILSFNHDSYSITVCWIDVCRSHCSELMSVMSYEMAGSSTLSKTTKKSSKLHIPGTLWGESTVDLVDSPHKGTSNAESVPISWCHYALESSMYTHHPGSLRLFDRQHRWSEVWRVQTALPCAPLILSHDLLSHSAWKVGGFTGETTYIYVHLRSLHSKVSTLFQY